MASTVGEVVVQRIRRYRQQQGLTQQALADRTEQLGAPISRDNLAKLETARGRTDTLTLIQVLVLAAALDVPPVLLFLPLGEEEAVEIIPGHTIHPHLAFKWIKGADEFTQEGIGELAGERVAGAWDPRQWQRNTQPIRMFDRLELLQAGLEITAIDAVDPKRIAEHAAYMRDAGLTVPEGIED